MVTLWQSTLVPPRELHHLKSRYCRTCRHTPAESTHRDAGTATTPPLILHKHVSGSDSSPPQAPPPRCDWLPDRRCALPLAAGSVRPKTKFHCCCLRDVTSNVSNVMRLRGKWWRKWKGGKTDCVSASLFGPVLLKFRAVGNIITVKTRWKQPCSGSREKGGNVKVGYVSLRDEGQHR